MRVNIHLLGPSNFDSDFLASTITRLVSEGNSVIYCPSTTTAPQELKVALTMSQQQDSSPPSSPVPSQASPVAKGKGRATSLSSTQAVSQVAPKPLQRAGPRLQPVSPIQSLFKR